jgi:hypothetical protein
MKETMRSLISCKDGYEERSLYNYVRSDAAGKIVQAGINKKDKQERTYRRCERLAQKKKRVMRKLHKKKNSWQRFGSCSSFFTKKGIATYKNNR